MSVAGLRILAQRCYSISSKHFIRTQRARINAITIFLVRKCLCARKYTLIFYGINAFPRSCILTVFYKTSRVFSTYVIEKITIHSKILHSNYTLTYFTKFFYCPTSTVCHVIANSKYQISNFETFPNTF